MFKLPVGFNLQKVCSNIDVALLVQQSLVSEIYFASFDPGKALESFTLLCIVGITLSEKVLRLGN